IISADITFYEDSNGKPGAEISSITELDPSSTTSIGSEFGFDVKNAVFEFEEEVEFEGQAGEAIYWVGIQIEYNGENSYMEVTTNMNTPNEIYYYDSDQSRWVGSSEPDADGGFDEAADGVIAFYGECIELEGCSGEPEAGEIAGEEDFEVCENGSFSLYTTGTTQASGLLFQWQQKGENEEDWTDIEDADGPTLQMISGISEDTEFRLIVECEASEESDTTEAFLVSVTPASECYCIPGSTNSSYYINNFTTSDGIDNINNTSSGFSEGGYGDFTNMILSQENTGEVSFEADIEGGTAGFRIWVDWNNDGDFSSDEVVYQSSSYSANHSGTFTIPEEATAGEKRMRMVSHWLDSSGNIDPCETNFTYGEFEDYTLNVIELEDCEGTPTAGTPEESEIEICAGIAFTVEVSDA